MGFRARKSFKLAPGVRLNLSKTGIGASFGSGPLRYSVHSSGRRTVSARTGIPGLTYQQSVRRTGATAPVTAQAPPSTFPTKPGIFAAKSEKELFRACVAQDAQAIEAAGIAYQEVRLPAYAMAGFLHVNENPERARSMLRVVFDGGDPAEHPFTRKYLSALRVVVSIAEGVTAQEFIGREAVGLALAEVLQQAGELAEAIEVVEQLEPSFVAAVSLADLYSAAGRTQDVIELTNGIQNEDDASALLLTLRGRAFRLQGLNDAAHETLKEALRSRSRLPEIRHLALSERAANYAAQGKNGMARKDLERILAEDSSYPGVAETLANLSAPSLTHPDPGDAPSTQAGTAEPASGQTSRSMSALALHAGGTVDVVGESYRQDTLEQVVQASTGPTPYLAELKGSARSCSRTETLWFRAALFREPQNEHDPNAIAVHADGIGHIGYLDRQTAIDYRPVFEELERKGYLVGGCPAFVTGQPGLRGVVLCLSSPEAVIGDLRSQ